MTTTALDLSQFYGTENYYKTCMFAPNLSHTDGVQYFADNANAYWFLNIIATEIYPLIKDHPFLCIDLKVDDGKGIICVEDGDCITLMTKRIEFTDCPSGEYDFYLTDDVLMLTSEY